MRSRLDWISQPALFAGMVSALGNWWECSTPLHLLNQDLISFEIVTVLNQMICTRGQTTFELIRDNNSKIGMNTTENKFYCLTGKISLLALNYTFFFLSPHLRDFSLCWDRWNGTVEAYTWCGPA